MKYCEGTLESLPCSWTRIFVFDQVSEVSKLLCGEIESDLRNQQGVTRIRWEARGSQILLKEWGVLFRCSNAESNRWAWLRESDCSWCSHGDRSVSGNKYWFRLLKLVKFTVFASSNILFWWKSATRNKSISLKNWNKKNFKCITHVTAVAVWSSFETSRNQNLSWILGMNGGYFRTFSDVLSSLSLSEGSKSLKKSKSITSSARPPLWVALRLALAAHTYGTPSQLLGTFSSLYALPYNRKPLDGGPSTRIFWICIIVIIILAH